MTCYDHKGNKYNSVEEMLKSYGVNKSTYYYKRKCGYSLSDILNKSTKVIFDHKGNEFTNTTEMCNYYGMSRRLYYKRLKEGKTMAEIFNNSKIIVDKYENRFRSLNSFCKFYKINWSQCKRYINEGVSIDDIVEFCERRKQDRKIGKRTEFFNRGKEIEFEGNTYKSVTDLCDKYNVKYNTYYIRKKRGFTLEECIYGKDTKVNPSTNDNANVIDHFGNKFINEAHMCRYHNVKYSTYKSRKDKGWPLPKCLSDKSYYKYKFHDKLVYADKTYKTLKALCDDYNINYNLFCKYRAYHKLSTLEAFDRYVKLKNDRRC